MTEADIIDAIVKAEGGYVDHPADRGGPTHRGITAATLGEYRNLGRPATRAEVKALGLEETRAIYRKRYVTGPGFTEDAVAYGPLRHQLIDHGVLCGSATAVRDLQGALGVAKDGVLGPKTQAVLQASNQPAIHREVTKLRVFRLARIVQADPTQLPFLLGWMRRAMSFIA